MLVGTRLGVSDIVRSVQDNDGSLADAARWFEIDAPSVETAMRFYRDHRGTVDGWIQTDDEYAERAERDWLQAHGQQSA